METRAPGSIISEFLLDTFIEVSCRFSGGLTRLLPNIVFLVDECKSFLEFEAVIVFICELKVEKVF